VPLPDTPFYDERYEKAYTQYDPATANQWLDEIGLDRRNAQGIRLRPDGQPLRVVLQADAGRQDRVDATEQVAGYWREVGIDATFIVNSRDLHGQRPTRASSISALVRRKRQHDRNALVAQRAGSGSGGTGAAYAHRYAQWYVSGGTAGREPHEPMKRAFAIYDQLRTTSDIDRQVELYRQLLDIWMENLWNFGIALRTPEHGIVRNGFANIPMEQTAGGYSPMMYRPETWFWDRADRRSN
jgi:ABC-type transport system substrate-binding protein